MLWEWNTRRQDSENSAWMYFAVRVFVDIVAVCLLHDIVRFHCNHAKALLLRVDIFYDCFFGLGIGDKVIPRQVFSIQIRDNFIRHEYLIIFHAQNGARQSSSVVTNPDFHIFNIKYNRCINIDNSF